MYTLQLQQRGVITLPKKLRDVLGLFEGQTLRVQKKDKSIVIEPQSSFDAQLAADIKESLEDIKHGRYITFSTIEEFHKKMKEKYGNKAD